MNEIRVGVEPISHDYDHQKKTFQPYLTIFWLFLICTVSLLWLRGNNWTCRLGSHRDMKVTISDSETNYLGSILTQRTAVLSEGASEIVSAFTLQIKSGGKCEERVTISTLTTSKPYS